MTNYCKVCKAGAKQKCSGCSSVFYCSRNCQVADWKKGHKNECKPYEVRVTFGKILSVLFCFVLYEFPYDFHYCTNEEKRDEK